MSKSKKKRNNNSNYHKNNKYNYSTHNDKLNNEKDENITYNSNELKNIDESKIDFNNKSIKSDNTFKTSSIDTDEINDLIDEDLGKKVPKSNEVKRKVKIKTNKHIFIHLFLILVLIIGIFYFISTLLNNDTSVLLIIDSLLITLITICFTIVGICYKKRNKFLVFFGGLLLCIYLLLGINNNLGLFSTPGSSMVNFTGKSLTDVIKWANKNNITVNQDYEYSDMVSEYKVISQDIAEGKSLKNVSEITVSVSEGPNPYKEVVVPSMLTWSADRVINFVNENYLSNVSVEFVSSDQSVDTVIEQSTSGNLSRDDEIKLTFSYGEELGYDEVNISDLTNKSKFEIEFYMKQHQLNYKFEDEFSSKIKKGFGTRQSIKAGESVKINDKEIVVYISKGPKIKVPDLSKMSTSDITEWAIKNKLKLKFTDKYDDSIKRGNIIKTDKNKGDILKQGDTVEVTLSRGSLKMPKFDNFDEFREWADKYGIKYEEKHEFNDDVKQGDVISYSYDKGDVIKNDDTIIVKISDGKKIDVPDLKGLTKKVAIKKLEDLDLKYNFIYKNSSKDKDIVIGQSISAGSNISSNVTITVTLSNGKKEEEKKTSTKKNNSSNSSNSNKNNSNNNNSNNNSNNTPTPNPTPSTKPNNCSNEVAYLQIGDTYDRTVSMTNKSNPKLKFTYTRVDKCSNGNAKAGVICNASSYDGKSLSTCNTYNLQVVG